MKLLHTAKSPEVVEYLINKGFCDVNEAEDFTGIVVIVV